MPVSVRVTSPTNSTRAAYDDVLYENADDFEVVSGFLYLYSPDRDQVAIFHNDGWLSACQQQAKTT